jgi:hypothetical protein
MSSDKKTITINPELFRISNTDRTGADDGGTKKPRAKRGGSAGRKKRAGATGGGGGDGRRSKELRAKQMRKELIRKLKESNKRKNADRRERERELERAKQKGGRAPKQEPPAAPATPEDEFSQAVEVLDRVVKQTRQRPAQHTFKAPKEVPKEAPKDAPKEAPREAPKIQIHMPAAHPVVPIQISPQGAAAPPKLDFAPRPPTPHAAAIATVSMDELAAGAPATPGPGLQPVRLKDDPPYGCLKVGGSKPTFSQYTMKNKREPHTPAPKPPEPHAPAPTSSKWAEPAMGQHVPLVGAADPAIMRRRALLQALRAESQDQQHEQHIQNLGAQLQRTHDELTQVAKKVIKKRYLKRTFKLGKSPGKASVPVLIRNQRTRRNIDSEVKRQCEVNIVEKKRYLKRRHLLKHGSVAPDYIIHDLYRNAITSGELVNKGGDVLLHNYLHGEEDL